MTQPCAVIGIGQTKHSKARMDVSEAGLLREAVNRALDDAQLTFKD
jgi:acetyl-CoA C-acetyltransferase